MTEPARTGPAQGGGSSAVPPRGPGAGRRVGGILLLIASTVCFSFHTNLVRLSYDFGLNPLTVLTSRTALTFLLLGLYFAVRRQSPFLARGRMPALLFLGLLFASQSFALMHAIERIPVSLTILIFYLFPILVILISRVLGHEALTPVRVTGAVAAFIGLVLALNVSGTLPDSGGVAMAAAGAAAISMNVVGSARMMRDVPSVAVVFNMAIVAVVLFGAALIGTKGLRLPAVDRGWLVFLAVLVTAPLALLTFYVALPMVGGPRTALIMNLEPVLTISFAVAMFGEMLVPIQFAGAALVIGAIFFVGFYDRR